jgi:hypothetical protein
MYIRNEIILRTKHKEQTIMNKALVPRLAGR